MKEQSHHLSLCTVFHASSNISYTLLRCQDSLRLRWVGVISFRLGCECDNFSIVPTVIFILLQLFSMFQKMKINYDGRKKKRKVETQTETATEKANFWISSEVANSK